MYGRSLLSKTCLLLAWLAASASSNAQQSRIVPLNLYGGAFDIVEDYEGGVLVLTDAVLLRFDPDLRMLWHSQYEHFSHKHIRYDARNKLYIVSSQQTEVGGYRMLAFNLKGEQVWTAKRDVYNYPGATNDKIEDFLVDSANGRILIVGKTWYYQQRKQAYWSAVADMQGNILREDRRFYRKIEDNPISLSGLTKRTDGKGYFAFATDGFDTYGEQTKIVRYDSNFNYLDSLPLLPLDRDPETLERTNYTCYDFNQINDSQFYAIIETSRTLGSETFVYIYDINFNVVSIHKKSEDMDLWRKYRYSKNYGAFNLHNYPGSIMKSNPNYERLWGISIKIPIHPKLPEEFLPHTEDPIYESYVIPSSDGGFYGYAWHYNITGILYIFKLDSLGRLYPNPPPERPELVVPVPNPARGQIRFDMPYHNPPLYPRHIRAVFYDMQGRLCLEVEGDKYTQHDISALRPGMYVVKTRIRENGEERTLKVMVE
jgi:hypothetical protein